MNAGQLKDIAGVPDFLGKVAVVFQDQFLPVQGFCLLGQQV
jgi:hypothetical protein